MKRFFSMVLTVAVVLVLATFFVQASAAEEAVTVDITSIVDGQTIGAGSNVFIAIDAPTLPEAGVKNIDVLANGVKLPGTIVGNSGSIIWYDVTEGVYDITTQITYVGGAAEPGDETIRITAVSDDKTAVVPVATPEISNGATKVCNEVDKYRINFDAPIYRDEETAPAIVKDAAGATVSGVTYVYGTDFVELDLPVLANDTTYTVSIPANTIRSYYSADVYVAETSFTFTTKPDVCGSAIPIIKMNYPADGATVLFDTDFAAKIVAPSSRIATVELYKGETLVAVGDAMTNGEIWFQPTTAALAVGETAEFTVKMLDENGALVGEAATATYTGSTTSKYAVKGIYEGAVIVNQHEPVRKITVVDETNANLVSDVATWVSKVEFYQNTELVFTDYCYPYEHDLTFKKYDENELEIKVYDIYGTMHPFSYNYYVANGVENSDSFEETFDDPDKDYSTHEKLKALFVGGDGANISSRLTLSVEEYKDGNALRIDHDSENESAYFQFRGAPSTTGAKVHYYDFDITMSTSYSRNLFVGADGYTKPEAFNSDGTPKTNAHTLFTNKNKATGIGNNSDITKSNVVNIRLVLDYNDAPTAIVYKNDELWQTIPLTKLANGASDPVLSLYVQTHSSSHQIYIDNFKYTVYDIAVANQAPVVSVTAPAEAAIGEAVTLTAQATDSDGTVSYVEFYADGALIEGSRVETGVDGAYTFNWVVASATANPESVAIIAKACDEDGDIGESEVANIAIVTKIPPEVTITSPATNTTYNVSSAEGFTSVKPSIAFAATDSDGTITDISVYVNDVKDGSVANPENATGYTLTNALTAGTYTIKVVVTDNSGMVSNASVNISVTQQETVTAPSYAVKGIYEGAHIVAQHEFTGDDPTRKITVVDSANANIVSDAATSVDRVEFHKDNALVATDYVAPYVYDLAFDSYDDHELEIKVYDVYGKEHPFSYTYYVVNGVENTDFSFEEDFDDPEKDYSTHEKLAALFVGGDGANIHKRLTLSVGPYPEPAAGYPERPTGNTLIITPDGLKKTTHIQFRSAASTTGAKVHYYDFDILTSTGSFRQLWVTADGYSTRTNAHCLFTNKDDVDGIGTNSALNKNKIVNIRLVLDYSGATPTALVYKNGSLWRTIPMTNLASGASDPVVTMYIYTASGNVYIDNFKYSVYDIAPSPAIAYDGLQTTEKISLTAKATNMEEIEGTILAALYDEDDHVSEVNTYDAAASVPVEFVQTTGNYIKLFWWYLDNLTPYSVSEKIDL